MNFGELWFPICRVGRRFCMFGAQIFTLIFHGIFNKGLQHSGGFSGAWAY